MNKKTKVLLIALGLVVLMAVPAFASQSTLENYRFLWGAGRQSNLETIADKAGVPVEELIEKRKSVSSCKDLLDEYGLDAEEIREARLEQQFKKVDEKVKEGNITEEEGKTIKEKMQSHKFLQDCNGPHHGKREGMKLNLKHGEGACGHKHGVGRHHGRGIRFSK
ncbi:MAG: hypothetical protein ACOCG5_10100 [Candidatus Alkaliphilus sp. MAG34]|nr:hypothetical protein [Clostridiales bacterium]